MSDDGTRAAKKIALTIQLDAALAHSRYLLQQMNQYGWSNEIEGELKEMESMLTSFNSDTQRLIESFYKVIGES
jgi:hypothetical protein